MSIKSINEPDGPGRTTSVTPTSINEPPTGENLPTEEQLTPVLEDLSPAEATLGSPSFDMHIFGTGFRPGSVIIFAGQEEPTQYDEDLETLYTTINMDVWKGPDIVKVQVRNGNLKSNELGFEFVAADGVAQMGQKQHRGTVTKTLSNKRSRNALGERKHDE